jgi:hypothetical protein
MSFARGVLKGFLSQGLEKKAAADKQLGDLVSQVQYDFFTNKLPQFREDERKNQKGLDQIKNVYNENAAQIADINGIYDLKTFQSVLNNQKLDLKKLEKAYFGDGTIQSRRNIRERNFMNDFENSIRSLTKGQGKIGIMTANNYLSNLNLDQKDSAMKTTDVKVDQTKEQPEMTQELSSTAIRDYTLGGSPTFLLSESDFSKVAETYFGKSLFILDANNEQILNPDFSDIDKVKYNALRQAANDNAFQFLDPDGKVNVGRAVSAGNEQLINQTDYHIFGTPDLASGTFTEGVLKDGNFSESFSAQNITTKDKKDALREHLNKLGSQEEREYYVNTFPSGVTFDDTGEDVKKYLEVITGIKSL